MSDEVTLSGPQADLCRAVLCQALMKTCQLLGKNIDADGDRLDDEGRYRLTRYSMEVQSTLLTFGMSSEELAEIVKEFSKS